MKTLILLAMATITASSGYACRAIRTLPLNITSNVDYHRDSQTGEDLPGSGGCAPRTPCGYGSPAAIGARIVINVNIVNMGNEPQSGVIRFFLGDTSKDRCAHLSAQPADADPLTAYATQRDSKGNYYYFNSAVCLCGSGDNKCATYKGSTRYVPKDNVPVDTVWKISQPSGHGQSASAAIRVPFVFTGQFADPTDASVGAAKAFFQFLPSFEIVVDQDQGAVIASMTYNILTANDSPPGNLCTVGPFIPATYMGYIFASVVPIPVPINGGRPF
jgi:hypothetical protein